MYENRKLVKKWNSLFKFIFRKNIDEMVDDFGFIDIIQIRQRLGLNTKQFPKQYLRKRYGKKAQIMLDELVHNKELNNRLPSERK